MKFPARFSVRFSVKFPAKFPVRFAAPSLSDFWHLKRLILLPLAMLLTLSAQAQPWSVPTSFFNSYYAQGEASFRADRGTSALPGSGLSTIESRGFSSKPFLGWRPSNFYGAELTYQPVPEAVFQPFGVAARVRHGYSQASIPVTINAYAPFSHRGELTGRLGYLLNSGQGSELFCFDASGRAYSCQNTPLTFGLGVRYELPNRFGLRMDYDYTELRDPAIGSRGRSTFLSLGADYRY
jgi:hypothetical protein